MSSVLERPGAATPGGLPAPRPLDSILDLEGEDPRLAKMGETWTAFCTEMGEAVCGVLDSGRSPSEIAYAAAEIAHNYFRTRGVTLTSYELRALTTELLVNRCKTDEPPQVAGSPPANAQEPARKEEKEEDEGEDAGALVSFGASSGTPSGDKDDRPDRVWTGGEAAAPPPVVPEAVFEPPPSTLVNLIDREAASFDRLLARVVAIARPHLGADPGVRGDRGRALATIDAAIDEVLRGQQAALPTDTREHLVRAALSEICGLGLIDRLWADRSIRGVFVDGPDCVHVDRHGVREPAPETFRSQAHLLELARRLARPASSGIVEFQLRDGGAGLVIFPPAAPAGPVLVIRRGRPGQATFERLIAADMLDRRIASLLRIAVRARLRVLVLGPEGSGKTALLAAIARDAALQRVVTLARHREFRWPSSGKVELVAGADGAGPSYATLLAAATRLQPDLLVLDSVRIEEVSVLATLLVRGARGIAAAIGPDAMAAALARSADLVVRLGQGRDGLFRTVSLEDASGAALVIHEAGRFVLCAVEPAFAAEVRQAGYGEALTSVLR